MLTIALWAAYSLRLSQLLRARESFGKMLLMAAAPVIGVIVFYMRGLYKLVTRFIGPEGTTRIYMAVIIAALLWALLVLLMRASRVIRGRWCDLWPDRRGPHSLEPAMGRRSAAQGGAAAQAGQLR